MLEMVNFKNESGIIEKGKLNLSGYDSFKNLPEPYTVEFNRTTKVDNNQVDREHIVLAMNNIDTPVNVINNYTDEELIKKSNYTIEEDAYSEDIYRFPLIQELPSYFNIETIKDEKGNVVCAVFSRPGEVQTVTYGYDNMGRLINEIRYTTSNYSQSSYYRNDIIIRHFEYYDNENVVKEYIKTDLISPKINIIQYDNGYKHKLYGYTVYQDNPNEIINIMNYRYEDNDNTEICRSIYSDYYYSAI